MYLREFAKERISSKWLMYRVNGADSIYITFDDGPHPVNTEEILRTLMDFRIRATFFLTGAMAERWPHLVRRIVGEGHTVGSHLYSHRSIRAMVRRDWEEEVLKTEAILSHILGYAPRLLRPPYGQFSAVFFAWALARGYRLVMWSDDSGDSFHNDARELTDCVRTLPLRAGSIMLFHEDYAHTAAALPAILECLCRRGFAFSALPGAAR